MSNVKDHRYDPISFDDFDKNEDRLLEEEPPQLSLEEDENMKKEEDALREEVARGKRFIQVNNNEVAIDREDFEDELQDER